MQGSVKYENFLTDPLKETKNICAFLGLRFEPQMLDVMRLSDKQGKCWNGDSSFEKKMEVISTSPIGRWKEKASPFEIFFVELVNREKMKLFDYELSEIDLKRSEWNRLYDIIHKNSLLKSRYLHWQKTGEGVEGYPSDPLVK